MSNFRKRRTSSFTRPADTTQYAVGDLVANSTVSGSVAALQLPSARFPGGNGSVKAVSITKSNASVASAAFRVHLFTTSPTSAAGDNAAFAVTNGRARGYLGSVDVTVGQALGDGAHGRATCDIQFDTTKPSDSLYALIEARGTYTPASAETFDVTFELERD